MFLQGFTKNAVADHLYLIGGWKWILGNAFLEVELTEPMLISHSSSLHSVNVILNLLKSLLVSIPSLWLCS